MGPKPYMEWWTADRAPLGNALPWASCRTAARNSCQQRRAVHQGKIAIVSDTICRASWQRMLLPVWGAALATSLQDAQAGR